MPLRSRERFGDAEGTFNRHPIGLGVDVFDSVTRIGVVAQPLGRPVAALLLDRFKHAREIVRVVDGLILQSPVFHAQVEEELAAINVAQDFGGAP